MKATLLWRWPRSGRRAALLILCVSALVVAGLAAPLPLAADGGAPNLAYVAGGGTNGGDLVVISITGPVYPFVFMAPASITSVQELKGKKIGVSNVGSACRRHAAGGTRTVGTRLQLRRQHAHSLCGE